MSTDFLSEDYQNEVRGMLVDLASTVDISNHPWNAWELEFIESLSDQLDEDLIRVTNKQEKTIRDLWDRL